LGLGLGSAKQQHLNFSCVRDRGLGVWCFACPRLSKRARGRGGEGRGLEIASFLAANALVNHPGARMGVSLSSFCSFPDVAECCERTISIVCGPLPLTVHTHPICIAFKFYSCGPRVFSLAFVVVFPAAPVLAR